MKLMVIKLIEGKYIIQVRYRRHDNPFRIYQNVVITSLPKLQTSFKHNNLNFFKKIKV